VKPTSRRPDFRAAATGFSNRRFSSSFAPPLTSGDDDAQLQLKNARRFAPGDTINRCS
jgi:hypothetical protein